MDDLPEIDLPDTDNRESLKDEYVKQQTVKAELALQGIIREPADIIYSGLQESGIYSEDPVIDGDPKVIARFKAMGKLPVKEYSVSPSGDWELTLSDHFIKEVEDCKWCVNCENPQPEDDDEWDHLMTHRAELLIGPRPEGATRLTNCPYCGFKLGIHGMKMAEQADPELFTPDQKRIYNEMFLGRDLT